MLAPQIAGDPFPPDELTTNESVVQSPMAPPITNRVHINIETLLHKVFL